MTAAVSNPGPAAAIVATGKTPDAVSQTRHVVLTAVTANTDRRVAIIALGSPPPRTRRMTARTDSVLVTNSTANGIATAIAVASESPPAIAIGTARPANASAAATSPYQDFSRPRTAATPSSTAGTIGTTIDHRAVRLMTRSAMIPAIALIPSDHASQRVAVPPISCLTRAPRTPSSTDAGSCATKAATALTATNSPAMDGPA